MLGVIGTNVLTAFTALWLAACVSQPSGGPQQPSLALTPNESWFECHARFECAVVYDSNVCAERAVNARHALEYDEWAREFLARAGESRDCAPNPEAEPRAVCRNSRCEIAENNLDALIEYTR
ncbi:MAG: hypothetical protein GWN29_13525 [Gammaproteobacteria bacterium]|nr:hypothetical protein [Gammaproteobacteria bacterium]